MKTILLVDDSEVVRMITRLKLEAEGYQIIEAEDGRIALDMLEEKPEQIALLVTDMQMPNMGGPELIQALRASDRYKYLPVIALTTSEVEVKTIGATACVQKNVDLDKLVTVVKKIIR